jgi:hypothetical protein
MILVPLFDLKFLSELAAGDEELQIGGTSLKSPETPEPPRCCGASISADPGSWIDRDQFLIISLVPGDGVSYL